MAIQIICNMCKKRMGDSGAAVLTSPPEGNGVTVKFHLCRGCYKSVEAKLI